MVEWVFSSVFSRLSLVMLTCVFMVMAVVARVWVMYVVCRWLLG